MGARRHWMARWLIAALFAALLAVRLPARALGDAPYKIDVDLVNEVVTILKNDGSDTIVLQCLCSSGAHDWTPTGTFVMPRKQRAAERGPWYNMSGCYVQYASRISGHYMFHSLPYTEPNTKSPDPDGLKGYGFPVSHGCVRLRTPHAKFIAMNCLEGTVVYIHKANERNEALRQLLYQSAYSLDSGLSYREFFGISDDPDALSNGSSGQAVRDLQLRLKDLGVYDGDISGEYALATVKAVRETQQLLGLQPTGCANADFLATIARNDAPSAMNVTLASGMSGPAVRALQQNLKALRLYDGNIDSVYDVDVASAVRAFQTIYGFNGDGVASPTVQKAVYYEAGHVRGMFAGADDYTAQPGKQAVYLGTVNCDVGIKLRREASTKSDALMSLRNGDTVVGLSHGETWSKVMKKGVEGYVMNRFMRYAEHTLPVMQYMGADGAVRCTLGYSDTNDNPAERFEAYLEAGGDLDSYDDLMTFATVNTGTGQPLNLRSTPSSEGAVLTTIPDGEDVEILLKSSDWSMADYNGDEGYVMSRYLDYWHTPGQARTAVSSEEVADAADIEMEAEDATVQPAGGGAARIYESGDEASAALGTLPEGTRVSVLETAGGWSLIDYQGRRGYVRESDLRFSL